MHIGTRIKLARITKGWKQEDLAEKIHKTRGLVSQIELTGKVNEQTLKDLEKALGISLTDIEDIKEPAELYQVKGSNIVTLLKERITSLENENAALKKLNSSQEEIIEMLRKNQKSVKPLKQKGK